jgi:2-haloacid dehalogenase
MMNPDKMLRPKIIVFDVYGTLLSMSDVERKVNQVMDSVRGYTIWFEMFMQYCFANNSLDSFHDFASIGRTTLQMAAYKLGRSVSESESDEVLALLKHLPVHEDVPSCLSELKDNDYTIVALTNAPEKLVFERMERTGLVSYFEEVVSSETVKKYKPDKSVYHWAARKLNSEPDEMLMITAHGWDIAGAANAGMKTAFLKRHRELLYSLSPEPDLSANRLSELVSALVAMR